jgi:CBS domain-containing protein
MTDPSLVPAESGLTLPVRRLLKRPPLFVDSSATVQEAAQAMQRAAVGSVLIAIVPPGIVSDRDLRGRLIAAGLSSHTPVTEIMSRPLKTIDGAAPAFEALRVMLEENIHHLPLIEEGKIIGVISAGDLLAHQGRNPVNLRAAIGAVSAPQDLSHYGNEIAALAGMLFESGLAPMNISRIISNLNDALVRRLVELAQIQLGPSPAAFAWIVFGSEGRLEQALLTDQDNALVYEAGNQASRDYFAELSRFVVGGLIQAGFPPCPGGFMATHWCKALEEWQQLFGGWLQLPEPEALLDAAIFFDFRAVAGTLSPEPLEEIMSTARNQKLFLGHLLDGAMKFYPPLGFFNLLRSENGGVDLKKGGIGPIVALARCASLAAGSRERSTLERLNVAGASGVMLTASSARDLSEIFPFFCRLRLRSQLAALKLNRKPSHSVALTELSTLERRHLREAFVIVKNIQEQLRIDWQLSRLG